MQNYSKTGNLMNKQFIHLHVHSECSLLDGISKPKDLVRKAANFNQPALAITNHGNLFDSIELYKEAKEVGIKPIMGIEFYLADTIPSKDRSFSHITILAQNDKGWRNLNKLVTISNKVGFYYRPRIDIETIAEHSEGLICLSGCMSSKLSKHILNDENTEALAWTTNLKGIFGDRFFIELMDGKVPGEDKIREASRNIARKLGIECVATQDSHYIDKDDWDIHEIACALSNNAKLSDKTMSEGGKRKRFTTNEFWFKSREELSEELTEREKDMTINIAEMCDDYLELGKQRIPQYDNNSLNKLKAMCDSRLKKLEIDNTKYRDRLQIELSDIESASLADYFMIVQDIVSWTKSQDIPVGPGRGSAAGSLVSYLLDITEIDPLEYGLIWERFYNRGRAGSMPDIDTDVCRNRREDVVDYIKTRFGSDRVANIMSLDKFRLRASIRDCARCLEIPLSEVDQVTKNIPHKGIESIEQAEERIPEVAKVFNKYPKLRRAASKISGTKRHLTMHPSAIVVTDENISDGCLPLAYNARRKMMMTGIDMYGLDDLGLLKIDILGLTTATLIGGVVKSVSSRY